MERVEEKAEEAKETERIEEKAKVEENGEGSKKTRGEW
jgi:hypothetical protein